MSKEEALSFRDGSRDSTGDRITSAAWFPRGDRIVYGSADGRLRLAEVPKGSRPRRLPGHQRAVTGVAVSPDGQVIASASEDKTVRLWDAKAGDRPLFLRGHSDTVLKVEFS